jgi:hypothetical protein
VNSSSSGATAFSCERLIEVWTRGGRCDQTRRIDYLLEENRVCREHLGKRQLRLHDE